MTYAYDFRLRTLEGLLSSGIAKVYLSMSDVDRRLRGNGYRNTVPQKTTDSETHQMKEYLHRQIADQIEMWRGRGQKEEKIQKVVPNARKFSTPTINALVQVITGGSGFSGQEPIGIYRTGSELVTFFEGLGLTINISSRVPSVRQVLKDLNHSNDGFATMTQVVEAVADPREYVDDASRLKAVMNHLNKFLELDGFELRTTDGRPRLVSLATCAPIVETLRGKAQKLDMGSVMRDFERAIESADKDPEGAVTSACSTIESVCKFILDEMARPYPNKEDVTSLVREVQLHLDLSPGNPNLVPHVKQILGGLSNTASGIGVLRTRAGDAHGRGKNIVQLDPKIARLAIHAASSVALFLIETWEQMTRS